MKALTFRPPRRPRIRIPGLLALLAPILLAAGTAGPAGAAGAAPGDTAAADTLYLSVDGAVDLALNQGEAAQLAREDVRIAEAQKGVVLANALPKLDFNASYNRNLKKPVIFFPDSTGGSQSITIGEDNAYQATLSLRQPLYSSGRVGAAYSASKQRARAAALSGDAAASDIAMQVKQAYYQALLARAQVRIARQSLDQAQRRQDEIQAKVDKGVTARFDLLRAQVEVANRKPALTRARNGAAVALEALKRAAGLPLDRGVALTDTLGYQPMPLTREAAVEEALDHRRSLEAAKLQAEAARNQLKAQSANDLPLLYLDGNYTWQGQTSDGLIPGNKETAQSAAVGLTLTWPIVDGWENRARTRQAAAQAEIARLNLRQLEEGIRLQTRSAWADVRSIAEEIQGVEESVRLAREAYRIAEVRYDSGLSTQLELLDAELALTQARVNRSETLYRYQTALAQLENVMGRGPALNATGGER